MFQLQLFFLLHCNEWDRFVALPRHKFVTGATLLQLIGPRLILSLWLKPSGPISRSRADNKGNMKKAMY